MSQKQFLPSACWEKTLLSGGSVSRIRNVSFSFETICCNRPSLIHIEMLFGNAQVVLAQKVFFGAVLFVVLGAASSTFN